MVGHQNTSWKEHQQLDWFFQVCKIFQTETLEAWLSISVVLEFGLFKLTMCLGFSNLCICENVF